MAKKTTEDLREILFAEIDSLRRETTDVSHANAVARLAESVINTAYLDMQAAMLVEDFKVLRLS